MNNRNNYKLVKIGLSALLGLILIISLFFNIYYISYLGIGVGESGFKFLTFNTELSLLDKSLSIVISILCLIQAIYGMICIFMSLHMLLDSTYKNDRANFILDMLNMGSIFLLVIFTIIGIIAKVFICDNIQYIEGGLSNSELSIIKSFIHTSTFWGLIIGVIIYALYWLFKKFENKQVTYPTFQYNDYLKTNSVSNPEILVNEKKPAIAVKEENIWKYYW